MQQVIPQKTMRTMIGLNYGFLAMLVLLGAIIVEDGFRFISASFTVMALAGLILTFYKYQVKPGLWSFSHKASDQLDERELMITHQSLSISYSFFTVLALAVMLLLAIAHDPRFSKVLYTIKKLDIILVAVLLYIAHTLPGAITGWREKEIRV